MSFLWALFTLGSRNVTSASLFSNLANANVKATIGVASEHHFRGVQQMCV